MKLEDWGFIYFRKLPYNFEGTVIFKFVDGKLKKISKRDNVDKERFLTRFKEVRTELEGVSHGPRSDDLSPTHAG